MEKRIYTCATAHLDTIWNWDFKHTVSVCLFNTLHDNFSLFEKYADYKFNFEGSYRYELFEEYYPEEFKKLKEYIAAGRWNVAGSAYENGDVNVPSPEALFRNILYGNGYFYKTFGKRSKDIYLPDCFGFGYALPSIIRHSNLTGFTTQKLTWGSAYGTPFDIGKWFGVNGKYCFACVRPDEYVKTYKEIREKKDNKEKLQENEQKYDLPWTFSFHGAGDQGGAPEESSVKVLEKEMADNGKNPIRVLSERSDKIYDDLEALPEEAKNKLPCWNNELLMRDHGAGGYTSRAIGKRLNRKGEELCDMTERSAAAGTYLGGMVYPQKQMEKAWKRIIAHQFHDDLPGTSVQRAYRRSWNDYFLSLNQLEKEYTHSTGTVARALDTSWCKGTPIVINNSIEQERKDIVEFSIKSYSGKELQATDCTGKTFPVQILESKGHNARAAFIADVPSLGFKVYDITEATEKRDKNSVLKISKNSIENEKYIVSINENGEISQIHDKILKKDLLTAPICHQLIPYKGSKAWPAWELTYKSITTKEYKTPVLESIRILYDGPVTVALKITSKYGNSVFDTIVSLNAGGKSVKVMNEVEWWEQATLYKDRFSLSAHNDKASYDLGLGVIERDTNSDKLFEVPAQKWADISEKDFGTGIISDCKYGWDKPDDHTLRMTVLHTPSKNFQCNSMQSLMDIGLNIYGFAVCSHGTDKEELQTEARKFNQPLTSVETDCHKGILPGVYSFGKISHDNIILRALKKAEETDEIVVRFNEGANKKTENIHFSLGEGIISAKEIYASEEIKDNAKIENGELIFDLDPYDIKSFALTLKPSEKTIEELHFENISLPYNTNIYSKNNLKEKLVINDYKELSLPIEIKPEKIKYNGIDFTLSDKGAVSCKGQRIALDEKFDEIYLLAYSKTDDHTSAFKTDGKTNNLLIESGYEYPGQWDLAGMEQAAHIKDCDFAFEFTHAHNERGADVTAKQTFIFCYTLSAKGVKELTLPDDRNIIILSAAGRTKASAEKLLTPLYRRISDRKYEDKMTLENKIIVKLSQLPNNAKPQPNLVKRSDGYIPR